MSIPLSRRALPWLAATLVAVSLGGCGLSQRATSFVGGFGSSAGKGMASGAIGELRSDSTRAAVRELADSSLASFATAYGTRLDPALQGTLQRLSDQGLVFVASARDTLSGAISGSISAALQELLRENVRVVTGSIQERGDRELKSRIKTNARDRKVEGYLHSFLEAQGHL